MKDWILVEHGNVLDATGAAIQPDCSILVQGTTIHAVGADVGLAQVPRGHDVTVVNATGKTVMPGLIDAHCHMTYGESRTEEEIDLYTSAELRTLKAAFHAQKVLSAGVTGISQPGGSYYIGVGLREAIADGIVQGPRMTSAGRYITTSNGLTDWYPDSVGVPSGSIGVLANSLPEMISEVRHQAKNGVDLIKLADSPFGDYQAFTTDEMKSITDFAHQLGKKVTIHARGSAEVGAAAEAGVDWIMHGNMMTNEVIDLLVERQIPLVPTLLLLANVVDWGERVGAPVELRDGMARALDKTADSLHRAHAAGVIFAMGTDSGFSVAPYGEWHARELELLMTYAGLSPMEAIQAGTRNGAVTLNLDGRIGTLEPGMIADILVIDGDPLANIRVLQDKRRIETVIQGGKIVVFNERALARRWPHHRVQTYSTSDLTYDLIHSGQEVVPTPPDWHKDEAMDLIRSVQRREGETHS
ncbi:amidohydrolase family protein [Mycobacterium sp. NAZ190054]|uniref:metal-dependent hydrolase family protein n=1 Tax=Mycobacterium sp. NAZ190054 TaxID=1747766 RepID=UPI000796FEB5|nr:amidohydrolase family protein [Mycobacterium sp. NAZ190054]KWX67331.1 amidohydrolase [Mycobacterium sp. NAZ190054]